MKKIIVFSILFICTGLFAQDTTELDGFWGMEFGSTKEQVKQIMKTKQTGILSTKDCSDKVLCYDGVKFGGRKSAFVLFMFIKDKFYKATIIYIPIVSANVIDLYDDIQRDINRKYYCSTSDYRLFKSPYSLGDGYEVSAIQRGYADYATFWKFLNNNYISLSITTDLSVRLDYEDSILADKNKQESLLDY